VNTFIQRSWINPALLDKNIKFIMGQKTPPPGLRLTLNRGYDSCWYQESKTYAKVFQKDLKYRMHLQAICQHHLPTYVGSDKKGRINFHGTFAGRILSVVGPKKYKYRLHAIVIKPKESKIVRGRKMTRTIQHHQSSTKKVPEIRNEEDQNQNSNLLFKSLLKVNLRNHQFGSPNLKVNSKTSFLKDSGFSESNKGSISTLERVGRRWNHCPTKVYVKLGGEVHLTRSAVFMNRLIARSLQVKKGENFRKTIRQCLKLAEKDLGIKGIRITCAGRFNGVDRARVNTESWGQTSLHRFDGHLDYSAIPAKTSTGLFGIKVWLLFRTIDSMH